MLYKLEIARKVQPMARRWFSRAVPLRSPPPGARVTGGPGKGEDAREPIDPQLADLRAALQHQFEATSAFLARTKQLKEVEDRHAGIMRRLASRLTSRQK